MVMSPLSLLQLFYDLAVYFSAAARCIRLVCINVHSQSELRAYTYYYIAKYQASAIGINLNGNNFFVLYS